MSLDYKADERPAVNMMKWLGIDAIAAHSVIRGRCVFINSKIKYQRSTRHFAQCSGLSAELTAAAKNSPGLAVTRRLWPNRV